MIFKSFPMTTKLHETPAFHVTVNSFRFNFLYKSSGVAKGGAWAAEHPQRKSERPQRITNKLVFRCIRFDWICVIHKKKIPKRTALLSSYITQWIAINQFMKIKFLWANTFWSYISQNYVLQKILSDLNNVVTIAFTDVINKPLLQLN